MWYCNQGNNRPQVARVARWNHQKFQIFALFFTLYFTWKRQVRKNHDSEQARKHVWNMRSNINLKRNKYFLLRTTHPPFRFFNNWQTNWRRTCCAVSEKYYRFRPRVNPKSGQNWLNTNWRSKSKLYIEARNWSSKWKVNNRNQNSKSKPEIETRNQTSNSKLEIKTRNRG